MRYGTVALCIYYLLALAADFLAGSARLRLIFALAAAGLTLIVLIATLRRGREYARLEAAAAVLLLPLCGFVGAHMVCGAFTDTLRVGLSFLAAFALSLPLFVRAKAPGCLIRFAAAFSGMLAALFLLFSVFMNASGFAPAYSAFSVLSPDGTRAANVLVIDEGALGGSVTLRVCPRTRRGVSVDGGKCIAEAGWCAPEDVSIRWIDDATLEFEGEIYALN